MNTNGTCVQIGAPSYHVHQRRGDDNDHEGDDNGCGNDGGRGPGCVRNGGRLNYHLLWCAIKQTNV